MIYRYIYNQFNNKLTTCLSNSEDIKSILISFSKTLTLQDFDETFLKPHKFILLCKQMNIDPGKLFDDYYYFVINSCANMLIQYREQNGLNQKQLASLLHVSPADLGLFEKSLKYPSRKQYRKIKEVLNG